MSDSGKENAPINPIVRVKPEPVDATLPLAGSLSRANSNASKASVAKPLKLENSDPTVGRLAVKKEPSINKELPKAPAATRPAVTGQQTLAFAPRAPVAPYTVYESVEDIEFTPENAFKEGLGMVRALANDLTKVELGSKLRKDVWNKEVEGLKAQCSPKTMIAVCGATGAGKSSLLNALLDDNIVPTSGMRACTAVITEISYQPQKSIAADVSFLNYEDWKAELVVLLEDMIDEDGSLKRSTDLRSDAGIAWHKVHAVYPTLKQEALVKMTADEIIASNPNVAKILGTTKNILSPNSKVFAKEISKYIDSKDQQRGEKKDKDKDKDKEPGEKRDKEKEKAERQKERERRDKMAAEPALWPLIRLVQVRCPSKALSTGAILVDLPGVADANAARGNIAKDYMKKCNCIWIAAPITRAVDDKTAKDLLGDAFKTQLMNGNYDDSCITFIATKTDDVSCGEVIRALNLEEDTELQKIEDEIEDATESMGDWKGKKLTADKEFKPLEQQRKDILGQIGELQNHIEAILAGDVFVPTLTAKKPGSKKRKSSGGGRKKNSKRRKSDGDFSEDEDDEDEIEDPDSEEEEQDDYMMAIDSESDEEDKSEKENSDNSDSEKEDSEMGGDNTQEEATEESLKAQLEEKKTELKEVRESLKVIKETRKTATDEMALLKKKISKLQKTKNGYCSNKRSEFSRDVLKEDFREGLKQLDQSAEEEKNPDAFDPTKDLRDYQAIDMPVFAVSSRDYIRITKQITGDGEPTCFTDKPATGIPALQDWCHQLTIASRDRSARIFLNQLSTFLQSVRSYVDDMEGVSIQDRMALRDKWCSEPEGLVQNLNGQNMFAFGMLSDDDDSEADILETLAQRRNANKNVDPKKLVGVSTRLNAEMVKVVDQCVEDLKKKFKDGLEDRCQIGAAKAEAAALEISDAFAASMHWGTYRATLRRNGAWRRDLNAELIAPLVKEMATSWARVFESDLFSKMVETVNSNIEAIVRDISNSAPEGLRDRCKNQAVAAIDEAKQVMDKIMTRVSEALTTEQKEISRCLAPHVQGQMTDGYARAMEERGKGSVARQKAVFHNFVEDVRDEVFTGGAETVFGRLDSAAAAVGDSLDEALSELASKVEVNMSVLWEIPKNNAAQVQVRRALVRQVTSMMEQIRMWNEAAAKEPAAKDEDDIAMED